MQPPITAQPSTPSLSGSRQLMKVAPGTDAKRLASAIVHVIDDGQEPVLRCIGASALNQAYKAVIIANGLVANRGITLWNRGGFEKIPGTDIPEEDISAIIMRIVPS